MAFSVLSDAPVSAQRDLLQFSRYYEPLLTLIGSDTLETPFTLGVFGAWGSGKSTLLEILEEKLQHRRGNLRFLCVRFNPWLYRRETSLLIPLLNALHEALNQSPIEKVQNSASKIFNVLTHLAADALLKKITAGAVDLEKLDKLEEAYLKRRGEIDNQLRNLRQCLQGVARSLREANVRIVFFIDDLDRCEPAEIVDVLESMKLFLDVENIVHILALDKEVIDRGIEVKYGKFSFGDRQKALGAEYLDKMIQMPVYLFPLHADQVRGYIRALDSSEEITDQIELLAASLAPNPRKIKRVLNMLALTHSILNADPKRYANVDWGVLTSIAILRVQEPELYTEVTRMPLLLVAMEEVYGAKRNVKSVATFVDFKDKAEPVRAICERFYKPAGPLSAIFMAAGGRFQPASDKLDHYLSVVGGF